MPLNDTNIRNAKPNGIKRKMADGGGLYLLVTPAGSKLWQMAYRFNGKQKTLSFGAYPTVGLKDARERREEAKKLLANGIDPGTEKKQSKAVAKVEAEREKDTFQNIAEEWYNTHAPSLSAGYVHKLRRYLDVIIYPAIGMKHVKEIVPIDILNIAREFEKKGLITTAHEITRFCGQLLRHAVITGRTPYNVGANLVEALQSRKVTHLATIVDPDKIGSLLCKINILDAAFPIRYFLKILPYVFTRPSELREAKWEEFTEDLWTIPADRMKKRREHIVPLSRQVKTLLAELRPYSEGMRSPYLFPSVRTGMPINQSTPLLALRRMGYATDEICVHGFRSMASTRLNEMNFRPDVIEVCLAHKETNAVRAAYNRAEYMEERRKLMQEWADYLDELRANG